jgi:FtsP/CotA-like multicopper oxidase with cupredoxin domain
MSRAQRAALLAAAAVIAALAVVLLQPDDTDDEKSEEPARTAQEAAPRERERDAEAEPRAPEPVRIRVEDGEPVGGVEEIEVDKGDRVSLVVTTRDTSEEVHVHGVDLKRDLAPGRPARFRFEADRDGVFEIELEGTHTQIAELRVQP